MALSNLFRINLPYGIQYNDIEKTFLFFNREYLQLGENSTYSKRNIDSDIVQTEIGTRYSGLTFEKVVSIVKKYNPEELSNAQVGNNHRVFFYNDASNPSSQGNNYENYFKILEELFKFNVLY